MLLLCALVGTTVNVWADSYTITFGNNASSNNGLTESVNASTVISSGTEYVKAKPFTVNSGKAYYGDNKTSIRLGKSGNAAGLTIALSDDGKVKATSIVVNCFKFNDSNKGTLAVNGMTAQSVPTSSAGNLTFTFANATSIENIVLATTKATFIYSITVNYSNSTKQEAGLSFDVPSYKVAPNTIFTSTVKNPNGLTVSYASDDEEIAYVDANGQVLTGDKLGTATITASSAANDTYDAGSATYTITVYDPNANDGSELKPYTVTEALALINTLGTASSSPVYVKGKVKEVTEYKSKYHSLTYNIEDLDDNTKVLLVYGGKNLGNTNFSATTDLSIGDEVVVYGSLKMYQSTPEFNQDNFISQLKHGSEPEVRSIEVKAANKYKSYVSSQNLVVPAGVTAYIATGETATELTLTSVPKIKAGTPVILYANATEDTGFSFQITDDEVTYPATNLLKISDGTVVNGAYVLAKKNDVVGFYKWAGGALSPGKVYVEPSSAAREFIGFNFDEVTDINEVKNQKETVNGIFDLQGRKVVTPSKGLYIVNGKKVVIK